MKMRGGTTAGALSASNGNAVAGGSRLLIKAAAIAVLVVAIVLLETSVVSKMHRRPSFEPPTGGGAHQSTSYQPFSVREGNRQASLLSAPSSKGLAVRGDRPPRSPVAVVSVHRHDEGRAGDAESMELGHIAAAAAAAALIAAAAAAAAVVTRNRVCSRDGVLPLRPLHAGDERQQGLPHGQQRVPALDRTAQPQVTDCSGIELDLAHRPLITEACPVACQVRCGAWLRLALLQDRGARVLGAGHQEQRRLPPPHRGLAGLALVQAAGHHACVGAR